MSIGPAIGVPIGLILFGILFNHCTAELNRRGYSEGYTWLLVVIGVAITVIASAAEIGWEPALVLLKNFVASGTPMAAGDIYRYISARRAESDAAKEKLHDPPQEMAAQSDCLP